MDAVAMTRYAQSTWAAATVDNDIRLGSLKPKYGQTSLAKRNQGWDTAAPRVVG